MEAADVGLADVLCFGEVAKIRDNRGLVCAAKHFFRDDLEEIRREVALMIELPRHENVIRYFTCCALRHVLCPAYCAHRYRFGWSVVIGSRTIRRLS